MDDRNDEDLKELTQLSQLLCSVANGQKKGKREKQGKGELRF
jgi:hypothetical protein